MGLHFAYGDYVTIYDAEDRPQPDQLRKALHQFTVDHKLTEGHASLACVQARLNSYNAHTNWLTKQFTQEYSTLFNAILPALSHLNLPFLLGGTSNHFRTDLLKQAGGWDAFNVTEDADLGIRLYRAGFHCATLDSTTYEESCTQFPNWFYQRTRWMKGWMQTYWVHIRSPVTLWHDLGTRGFVTFQILLGGQILASLSYLLFLLIGVSYAIATVTVSNASPAIKASHYLIPFSLFMLGYGINIWLGMLALKTQKNKNLTSTLIWIPLYWLLISLASFRALYQLFTKPFYWEKTEHGILPTQKESHKKCPDSKRR